MFDKRTIYFIPREVARIGKTFHIMVLDKPILMFGSAMVMFSTFLSIFFVHTVRDSDKDSCLIDISFVAATNAVINIASSIGTIIYWVIDSPLRIDPDWKTPSSARILAYFVLYVRLLNIYAFSVGNLFFYMYWYAGCNDHLSSMIVGCATVNSFTWATVAVEMVHKSAYHTMLMLGVVKQEKAGVVYHATPVRG